MLYIKLFMNRKCSSEMWSYSITVILYIYISYIESLHLKVTLSVIYPNIRNIPFSFNNQII